MPASAQLSAPVSAGAARRSRAVHALMHDRTLDQLNDARFEEVMRRALACEGALREKAKPEAAAFIYLLPQQEGSAAEEHLVVLANPEGLDLDEVEVMLRSHCADGSGLLFYPEQVGLAPIEPGRPHQFLWLDARYHRIDAFSTTLTLTGLQLLFQRAKARHWTIPGCTPALAGDTSTHPHWRESPRWGAAETARPRC